MQLFRQLPSTMYESTALAIGNFDGLHLGHRAVINAMLRAARAQQATPSVLTFEPHPHRFFKADTPDFRISSLRDKLISLRNIGVYNVFIPRFDASFASIMAEDFLDQVLLRQLNVKVVVTGENFVFGHKRRGDVAMLKAWGVMQGVKIITMRPVFLGDAICSSSAVRTAIAAGDMAGAAALLGRPYRLSGHVVHGDARGRTLGFPTANVALTPGLLLPFYGVYAVRAMVDGVKINGVANLGVRPSFGSYTQLFLEVHLFDFIREIYGKILQVELLEFLRPEMKFDGEDSLRAQIARDCVAARLVLARDDNFVNGIVYE